MVIDELEAVPLMVLEYDGSLRVVVIPHLSEEAFEFLRKALDTYKAAIVRVPKAKPRNPP